MRPVPFLVLLPIIAIALSQPSFAAPALNAAAANATIVPEYGLFELTPNLTTTYTNPFDPAQIDLGADFTGPDGQTVHVNGYWFQDYVRTRDDKGHEVLAASGIPGWRIRFAPDQPGVWRYTVTATDATGTTKLHVAHFNAVKSDNPGFVRVSSRNPRAFAFTNGAPYFAIGQDMCYPNTSGTYDYDSWLPKMHASGGNWARFWSVPGINGLEWRAQATAVPGGYGGLGVYSLQNAWRLDKNLDTAEANGVYCQLTIGNSTEFDTTPGGGIHWKSNPYNAANGGPCATPADFWTNPTAQKYYEQRVRYISARYGWRSNIAAWEFWNETPAPPAWVREMSQCFKGTGSFAGRAADPFHHLVTTTYGNDEIWRIPEVDITETHLYGSGNIPDMTPVVVRDAFRFQQYDKPHLLAETGIDGGKGDNNYDKNGSGENMHDGMWAAAAAGDAGTSMLWYWVHYIDPENMYHEYTAVAEMAVRIPWTAGPWTNIIADRPSIEDGAQSTADVTFPASGGGIMGDQTEFSLPPGSSLPTLPIPPAPQTDDYDIGWKHGRRISVLPGPIFSPGRPGYNSKIVLYVDFPKSGLLIAHVNKVSDSANLQILLDGRQVAAFPFDSKPPTDGTAKPTYLATKLDPKSNLYLADFDTDCEIDVPAGRHKIELDNSRGDWLAIDHYRLTNYRYDNVQIVGRAQGRTALIWLHNSADNWKNVADAVTIPVLHGVATHLHGLPAGSYTVTAIDTNSGATIATTRSICSATDGLPVRVDTVATDVALVVSGASK